MLLVLCQILNNVADAKLVPNVYLLHQRSLPLRVGLINLSGKLQNLLVRPLQIGLRGDRLDELVLNPSHFLVADLHGRNSHDVVLVFISGRGGGGMVDLDTTEFVLKAIESWNHINL